MIRTSGSVTSRGATGLAAIAAGLLMYSAVLGSVLRVQETDGTVTAPALFSVLSGAYVAGCVALVLALRSIRALNARAELPRPVRIGTWLSSTGALLLAAFGLVILVSGLAVGRPMEASFVLFALGLLLLIVGHVALSVGLRRTGVIGAAWLGPLLGAVGLLVAVAVEAWHDLGLTVFSVSWIAVGAYLSLGSQRRRRAISRA